MYQSGTAAMVNVGPIERGVSCFAGGLLLFSGLRRRSLPLVVGGGALLYRGASGFCPVYKALDAYTAGQVENGLKFEAAITVQKPVEEIYPLWRNVENLPRFMSHLESVNSGSERRSHWVAKIPSPLRLEWDAEITEEHENQSIAWRSLPDSSLEHTGAVLFRPVAGRNATEVKVAFSYKPPAGGAGAAAAKLFSALTEHQIREDLRGFKALLEAGEKPTTSGQSSGRA